MFFYNGILGKTLPPLKKLVDIGLYANSTLPQDIKIGTIGLAITQKNILEDAIEKNYENILFLEDDISFDQNYFLVLEKIFAK